MLTAVLTAGCEIERVAIPRTESRIAMHGVLSATAATQVVLLERTRNGSFEVTVPFDIPDPVVSDDGVAESGAIVALTTPSGQTVVAVEDNTVASNDGKGTGIYRWDLPGTALERNGKYVVSVFTSTGGTLAAETSVPAGATAAVAEQRTFDRARDTVLLDWPASPGARSYLVRIETPYGPRSFFTDSTRVRLTGELRNVDAAALRRVFMPGFPQAVTVSAVDSNYYDWYRTHNERISGTGVISRVTGGIGVFGSLVRLRFLDFRVVAPQSEPEAGNFRFEGTQFERSVTPFWNLELYVESRAARADQADAVSGRYEERPILGDNETINGVLGTVRAGFIELAFIRGWSAKDTVEVFTGEIRGDTIVGQYRGLGGAARFVRQP